MTCYEDVFFYVEFSGKIFEKYNEFMQNYPSFENKDIEYHKQVFKEFLLKTESKNFPGISLWDEISLKETTPDDWKSLSSEIVQIFFNEENQTIKVYFNFYVLRNLKIKTDAKEYFKDLTLSNIDVKNINQILNTATQFFVYKKPIINENRIVVNGDWVKYSIEIQDVETKKIYENNEFSVFINDNDFDFIIQNLRGLKCGQEKKLYDDYYLWKEKKQQVKCSYILKLLKIYEPETMYLNEENVKKVFSKENYKKISKDLQNSLLHDISQDYLFKIFNELTSAYYNKATEINQFNELVPTVSFLNNVVHNEFTKNHEDWEKLMSSNFINLPVNEEVVEKYNVKSSDLIFFSKFHQSDLVMHTLEKLNIEPIELSKDEEELLYDMRAFGRPDDFSPREDNHRFSEYDSLKILEKWPTLLAKLISGLKTTNAELFLLIKTLLKYASNVSYSNKYWEKE